MKAFKFQVHPYNRASFTAHLTGDRGLGLRMKTGLERQSIEIPSGAGAICDSAVSGGPVPPRQAEPIVLRTYWNGRARLYSLATLADTRGTLLPLDFTALPFVPKRSFVVQGVGGAIRGGHAHAHGQQLLCCLVGEIDVEMRHDADVRKLRLSTPTQALGIGPGVWAQQRYGAAGATLLVFASAPYDPTSYMTHGA